MKLCRLCQKEKPLDQFSCQSGSRDRKRHQCKECELQRNREWRAKRKAQFDITKVDFDALKQCSVCKQEKEGREFHLDYTTRSGLQTCCKSCGNENTSRWQRAGRYGLKPGEYEEMLSIQNYTCGICRSDKAGLNARGKPGRFHIDHNHETGEVRGLLCSPCNKGLGHFRDDPEIMKAAIEWINMDLSERIAS